MTMKNDVATVIIGPLRFSKLSSTFTGPDAQLWEVTLMVVGIILGNITVGLNHFVDVPLFEPDAVRAPALTRPSLVAIAEFMARMADGRV